MKARMLKGNLAVELDPSEVDEIAFYHRTIGTRYGSLFDNVPHGFNDAGKISVGPLSAIEEDTSGKIRFVCRSVVLGKRILRARIDTDGDIALHASEAFWLDARPPGQNVIQNVVQTSEFQMNNPDVAEYLNLGSISLTCTILP